MFIRYICRWALQLILLVLTAHYTNCTTSSQYSSLITHSAVAPIQLSPSSRAQFAALCDLIRSTNIATLRNQGRMHGWRCDSATGLPIDTETYSVCGGISPTNNNQNNNNKVTSNTFIYPRDVNYQSNDDENPLNNQALLPWTGIICQNEEIVYLELPKFALNGHLPDSIGVLTKLRALVLSHNALSGSIPESISGLVNIRMMLLDSNQFTSSIPPSIGNLKTLMILTLNNNILTGSLPLTMGDNNDIRYIDVSHNTMLTAEIRSSFSTWSKVYHIDMSSVAHGRIDKSVSGLTSLQYLSVSNGHFTGEIPKEFGSLSNLVYFYAATNFFSGTLPTSIVGLTACKVFDLSYNSITNIPNTIGNMTHLERLLMISNLVSTTIPATISSLKRLQELDLSLNDIIGSLPSNFAISTVLSKLRLSSNIIHGTIPESITNNTMLKTLDIQQNKLTGSLPYPMGRLVKLVDLWLDDNSLVSTIPKSIVDCTSLATLSIRRNSLMGSLPGTIKSVNFANLWLSYNSLTGSIPRFFANAMNSIIVANNRFTGQFPPLTRQVNLYELDLRNNFFTGTLPGIIYTTGFIGLNIDNNMIEGYADLSGYCLGSTYSLNNNQLTGISDILNCVDINSYYVHASHNFIHQTLNAGAITNSFLSEIDISYNFFHGPLPAGLNYFTSLYYFYANDNQFSGQLPVLSGFTRLYYLKLHNNRFSANITDDFFTNLPYLRTVDLHNNKITGSLPRAIGSLGYVKYLDLSYNRFNFTLPNELFTLTTLTTLDLSHNGFRGAIPDAVSQFTNMDLLSFAYNHFTGTLPILWASNARIDKLLFQSNFLHGTLSNHLSVFTKLKILDLSYNRFVGQIPVLSTLTNLQSLALQSNRLTGTIPVNLAPLTKLTSISFSDNALSCRPSNKLPSWLTTSVTSGRIIHLGLNKVGLNVTFSSILSWLTSATGSQKLQTLNLSHNAMLKTIPESLSQFTALRILDLSYNSLTGPMPFSLCGLTNLKYLSYRNTTLKCAPECLLSVLDTKNMSRGSTKFCSHPTSQPTGQPSSSPTNEPTKHTSIPTFAPTYRPNAEYFTKMRSNMVYKTPFESCQGDIIMRPTPWSSHLQTLWCVQYAANYEFPLLFYPNDVFVNKSKSHAYLYHNSISGSSFERSDIVRATVDNAVTCGSTQRPHIDVACDVTSIADAKNKFDVTIDTEYQKTLVQSPETRDLAMISVSGKDLWAQTLVNCPGFGNDRFPHLHLMPVSPRGGWAHDQVSMVQKVHLSLDSMVALVQSRMHNGDSNITVSLDELFHAVSASIEKAVIFQKSNFLGGSTTTAVSVASASDSWSISTTTCQSSLEEVWDAQCPFAAHVHSVTNNSINNHSFSHWNTETVNIAEHGPGWSIVDVSDLVKCQLSNNTKHTSNPTFEISKSGYFHIRELSVNISSNNHRIQLTSFPTNTPTSQPTYHDDTTKPDSMFASYGINVNFLWLSDPIHDFSTVSEWFTSHSSSPPLFVLYVNTSVLITKLSLP